MIKDYPIGVIPLSDEEGGGFLGVVGDLPGCMSHGDSPEEALSGAHKAILEWLDQAKEEGFAIPEPGSAALRMRQERVSLLTQLRGQRQACEKLEGEVKVLRANLEALLDENKEPDERQPAWMATAVYAAGKKREHVQ